MHENPEATEEEQAQGGRQAEEEAMRHPGHDDLGSPAEPADSDSESEE